jgi:hypothetical protein
VLVPRPALAACSLTVCAALAAGCGGDDGSAGTEADDAPSPTTSASPSATSASPSKDECAPPAQDVAFTRGTATLEVTAGPDVGRHDLSLDGSAENGFAASDGEITGTWQSADGQAVLFIDIEGVDPCDPDAFTSIGTRGPGGPLFVDSSHTACTVELSSLGPRGVVGTFDCSGMTGGGEGLERDAHGTFSLAG